MYKILFLVILLCSCSAQQRLNRKVNRAEKFANKHSLIIQDTITVRDTIVTERTTVDTVFKESTFLERLHDTIIIKENNLTIRQYYHNNSDTIRIEGECDSILIPYEVQVPVDKIKVVEGKNNVPWWMWLIIGGVTLVAILALRKK
jgi:hypothetical protein